MKTHLVSCVIAALMLQSLSPSSCSAQIGLQRNMEIRAEIFLPAPRSLQRLLAEGRLAIAEGRYADGISSLGSILQDDSDSVPDDLRGQDFFLRGDTTSQNRSRTERAATAKSSSIKSEAIKELNKLPLEGRRALEIQFGVKARQTLDEAIAKRDLEAVSTVARRYIHTEAGYDAMLLIAQSKLTNGYPLAAADIYQMLLDCPAARERYGVGLAEAAAVCWIHAGNRPRAISTLKLAGRDFANQSLTINGQQIPIEKTESLIQAIEPEISRRNIDRSTDSWLVAGGTASRNATSELSMPLPNERWSWAIHSSRPEGAALVQAEETQRKNGRQLLPKTELRMLGNTVISRSNDSTIIGLDFETGLLRWQRTTPTTVAPLKGHAWEHSENDVSQELKNRIWGSNSFGRITCDTQRCYHVVQKQGEAEPMRGLGMRQSSSTRLEGLSIAGEGEILWSLGGTDSDDLSLSTAYFLGPPLPYAGQLFSLIEINGQIELIVLQPETGKLIWRQQLAAANYQIEYDLSRQSQGLTPSISDGVIICPTGIGGVVAMDLLTRSLRWGSVYSLGGGRVAPGFGGAFGGNDYDPLEGRWTDESLVIENGILSLTPQDSDLLLAYDLLSGEELLRRPRSNGCYVAGIYGQSVIVVNNRSIQAIDVVGVGGTVRWDTQFPDALAVAGKGIWEDGKLLLPMTGNKILQFELKDGKIINSAEVSQPLGNIFAYKGVLLSVTPTAISSYYTRQQLKSTVEARLAKNPKDVWGLNYQSQLMLADGKTSEAFGLLLDSYAIDPEDLETRFFLVDAMLAGLQLDFNTFSKYTERLDSIVVPSTPQRLRYLQLLAKGLVEQGRHFEAFKRLWEIMLERQEAVVSGAQSRTTRLHLAPDHYADLDAWFAVELGRTFEKCDPQQQAEIRRWVADTFTRLKTTVITVRRQLLRHMLYLPAADSENLDLAKSLMKFNEQTGAEQILLNLAGGSNAAVRDEAIRLLQELPEADRTLLSPSSKIPVSEYWPQGLIERQLEEIDDAIYPIGRPVDMVSNRFGRPEVSLAASDRLVLSDINGKAIYSLAYRPATSDAAGTNLRAEMQGGLLLIESSSELIGVDYYRGRDTNQAILWRFSLESAAPGEPYRGGSIFESSATAPLGMQRLARGKNEDRNYFDVGPLLTSAKIVQSGGSVIALDPYSGRKLWTREGYTKGIRFAGSRDSHLLCIVNPSKAVTEFIDARDGKLLKLSKYLVEEMSQRWLDKIKSDWEQWFSHDNWIVDYVNGEDGSVTLRVWNPVSEKTLYQTALSDSARVAQSQRKFVAVISPSGQLELIDLVNEKIHQYKVPVDKDLVQIGMLKFTDQLVIITNNNRSIFQSQLNNALQANGYVYCINSKNLELQWTTPGQLYDTAIPLVQPRNSPLMALCRTVRLKDLVSPALAILDLRNGKIVYSVEGVRVDPTTTFSMQVRPESHELTIMMSERYYRFKVTDLATPPEPIAHYGGVFRDEGTDDVPARRDDVNLFEK